MNEITEIEVGIDKPEIELFGAYVDPLEDMDLVKSVSGLSKAARRAVTQAVNSTNAEDRYYQTNGYGIFKLATPPFNLDELASHFDTSPTHHAAVLAKVSNIVGLGFSFNGSRKAADKIQNIDDEESRTRAERKLDRQKTDMLEWLESLNKTETFQYTLTKAAIDFEVFGNCYFEVGRTVAGDIGYFGHIPASTVRVRMPKDGFIQIVGNQITYFRNYGEYTTSPLTNDSRPNEIIHIKKYSPRSSFYGVPDSASCITAIMGDALAARYNLKFFDNSATPRYIVTLTGARLSKVSEDKLFKFLQTSLRGEPHRTLFIPLPNDPNGTQVKLEMVRVDAQVQDGSWENYRDRNKADILMAHGVPENRVGGGLTGGTATAISSDRMFKEQVVVPSQEVFEQSINRMIQEITQDVYFDLNELALIDEVAQSQIDERYLRNRVVLPNEIRVRNGWPALPEGNQFVDQNSQVQAEQNAQANNSRERDKQRVANNSDSTSTISGRNAKGEGPKE